MRFTRRGRLLLTIMTGVTVVTLAVVLASAVDAAGPQIDHATTVSAGQTLSEVAAVQLPSLPVNDALTCLTCLTGIWRSGRGSRSRGCPDVRRGLHAKASRGLRSR